MQFTLHDRLGKDLTLAEPEAVKGAARVRNANNAQKRTPSPTSSVTSLRPLVVG